MTKLESALLALFLAVLAGLYFGARWLKRRLRRGMFAPPLPYHREAIRYLWTTVHGQPIETMPHVVWVEITAKNRTSPGGYRGVFSVDAGGEAWPEPGINKIHVGWDALRHKLLADTQLAHEIGHMVAWRERSSPHAHDTRHAELTARGNACLRELEEREHGNR
jgi:hypothetical protein